MEDSISAMLRVYVYLSELEEKVGVPQVRTIESIESNPSYVTYGSLVTEMRKLHVKCQGFGLALSTKSDLPVQPETIFEVVWRDVTFKSKIIALCGKLGPHYLATILAVRNEILEENKDPKH
jgi:hypothetical protein